MTVDEMKVEYEKLCAETHTAMCYAILSYDDPNYEKLSRHVWDLIEKRDEMQRLLDQEQRLRS